MQGTPGTAMPAGIHPWVAAGRGRGRFGVAYGPQIAPRADWPALVGFVQDAEARGFDSYWTADHPTAWPECWATLALLAARTTTIRLGPLLEGFRTSAIIGTPAEVRDAYRALVAAGMQYCIAVVVGDDRETLHLLAEQVIPALQARSTPP